MMKSKKLIGWLLALVMCIGLMPTFALAADTDTETENTNTASHQYLKDITLTRSATDNSAPYMRAKDGSYLEFKFDPAQTEYDILLEDTALSTRAPNVPVISVTLNDNVTDNLWGAVYKSSDITDVQKPANSIISEYQDKKLKASSIQVNAVCVDVQTGQQQSATTLKVNTQNPLTVYLVTGKCESREEISDDGKAKYTYYTFSETDVYTFHFYRKATLKSNLGVAYEDGTAITEGLPTRLNANLTEYEITGVAAGTEKLVITAPAYTQNDTVVKYDDGMGTYVVGTDATTFTVDLTQYTPQKDGSVVVPFMLDYTGDGCGVDGYYTLTVHFAAAPAKPVITAEATATVDIGDFAEWQPTYSATGADGSDATSNVDLTYYQADGITLLADLAAVREYIGDAKTNNTFVVTFNLTDAEPVKMTVTVKPAETKPDIGNGFVKNIKLLTIANANLLSPNREIPLDFQKGTTEYNNIEMPLYFSNDGFYGESVRPYLDIEVELADGIDPSNMSYIFWGSNAAGQMVFNAAGSAYEFGAETIKTLKPSYNGWFSEFPLGDYTFSLSLLATGDPDTQETYNFHVKTLPTGFIYLFANSGNNDLTLAPVASQANLPNALVTEYTVTTPGLDEITLKGRLQNASGYCNYCKIYYNDQDITADFNNWGKSTTEGGFTVDLTKCAQTDDGQYIVPLTIKFDRKGETYERVYTIYVTKGEAAGWAITGQPQSGVYDKGDKVTLSVEVTGDKADDISYQWQYVHGLSASNSPNAIFFDIAGATESTFTPPTNIGGIVNYRCIITDNHSVASQKSDVARIETRLGTPCTPEIVVQPGTYAEIDYPRDFDTPYKTAYYQGEKVNKLQIAAGSAETPMGSTAPAKVEFQWFYNDENSYEGATLLDSADYSTGSNGCTGRAVDNVGNYVVGHISNYISNEKLPVGEHYYFCEVTIVDPDYETNRSATTQSNIVKITILPRTELDGFEGKGTEENPYIIENLDHLKKIDEYVLSGDSLDGAVFQIAKGANITLPVDWEPIGENNGGSGKGLLPFSGTIDGNGQTLTIASGGKPLLEYARNAVVRNLNIKGEQINGAGLLEKICVDYGTDGIYQADTDPDIITIENVTLLSGSQTKDSGLVGGHLPTGIAYAASGINDIFIRNCTIEDGVVIGYTKEFSQIGSFAGRMNGHIENSVSYATVYGTSSIGGLVGRKDQTMGDCEIVNSAFLGEIVATGGKVGGIIGAGYIDSTAPNTPPVTIRNCYVDAKITGDTTPSISEGYDTGSGIGGILGSEIGLSGAWNNAAIRDNHFYGTITDNNPDEATKYDRVGGILGEMGNYDAELLDYANNYYLANDNYTGLGYQRLVNKTWQPEKTSFIAKTADEFANGDVTALLNEGEFQNWMQSTVEGKEYPVHSDKPVLYRLEVSGEYKDTFYIGDKLDLTGMVLTGVYTDGSTEKILLTDEDLKITGYDPNKQAFQTIDLTYGAAKTSITVKVLKKPSDDPAKDNFTVYFTLLGDSDHGESTASTHTLKDNNLQVWLPREAYTVKLNATVWDLMQAVQQKYTNVSFSNPTGNYVDKVTFNNVTIGEFTNGQLSGWMYTLDDEHPLLGVSEQFLDVGNEIVFHYTDDYTVEEGSDKWDTPSGGSSGGTTDTEKPEVTTEMKPEVTANAKGEAIAKPDDKAVTETIEQAKADKADVIVIEPDVKGDATKVGVELTKSAVEKMTEDTNADLTVKTDLGNVTVPAKGLEQLTKESGSNVTVTVEAKDGATNVEVAVGGKAVEKVAGGIGVTVPAAKASEGNVLAIVKADGTQEIVKKSVVEGKNVQAIVDGSCTVKVIENGRQFADTTNHWGKDAVLFVTARELFNGTSDKAFEPDVAMSRAMLATVLWRLEDEPSVTAAKTFSDIANGQYYTEAVAWASDKQIVTGYEDGTFQPNKNINREELAAMLYRYAKAVGLDTKASGDLTKFADGNKVSAFATDAMKWAVGSGLMNGKENNTLDPQGNATRAEVATTMQRLVKLLVK